MQWTDTAILLSMRKHGENSAVARLFAREHGVYSGVVRGVHSKANRGILQPGNIVTATWQARLFDQLGTFKCELVEANTAFIMHDAARLAALVAACSITESALPERHPYPKFFTLFQKFLGNVKNSDFWQQEYVLLELALLAESGFGLDLTNCAATGATENLLYVSPKSGRAVSRDAGEPYKERLLRLPEFLLFPRKQESEHNHLLSRKSGEDLGRRSVPLKEKARELRKNMTDTEKALWYHLRAHRFEGYAFRRQYPIHSFIVDFICLEKKLIIEVDGGQHAEQQVYDDKRTAFLEQEG